MGVSLHKLRRGAVKRGVELYSPCKEAYKMLKEALIRGPSIVFTYEFEAGITKIRSLQIGNPGFAKTSWATTPTPSICRPRSKKCPAGREGLSTFTKGSEASAARRLV